MNDIKEPPSGAETNEHMLPAYADLQLSEADFDAKLQDQYGLKQNKTEAQYVKEFLLLVNKPFPEKWLKETKVGGGRTIKYAPINKIEFLLTRTFGAYWKREILFEAVFLNTIVSRVRLWYKIPGTTIWLFHDGAGGSPIQVDSLENPADRNSRKIKPAELDFMKSGAIQQAYPASVSFALSNAAEKIGELFGRNLNKEEVISYEGSYDPFAGGVSNTPEPPKQQTSTPTISGMVHVEMPTFQPQAEIKTSVITNNNSEPEF